MPVCLVRIETSIFVRAAATASPFGMLALTDASLSPADAFPSLCLSAAGTAVRSVGRGESALSSMLGGFQPASRLQLWL